MNLADTEQKSGSGSVVSNAVNARLGVHWLMPVRIVIVIVAVLALAVFCIGVLLNFAQFRTVCTPLSCADGQLTPQSAQALQALGLSLDAYAIMNVVFLVIQALVYYLLAAVIFWQRPDEWLTVIVVLGFLAAPTNSLSQPVTAVPPVFPGALACVQFLGIATFILIAFLFPNGRFVPRWTLPFAAVGLVSAGIQTFLPDVVWPPVLAGINWVSAFSVLVFAQLYRYRKVSSREQRQQTKWFVFGFTGAVMINLVNRLLPLIFPLLAQQNTLLAFISGTISDFGFLLIPLAIGFAILRYKLWDIDIIINRTLVYGTLTVSIVGLYVLAVVSLGTLLQGQGNLFISLLATGLIAVLFQPLRLRLQRAINRLMYGERDMPYTVISRLGQRLEAILAPEAVLPTIVETVAQALKLPYAAITLKQQGELALEASYGLPKEGLTHFPLVYQNEQVGELLLAPRTPGESFTPADQRLLDDLVRQAGVAVHAMRLTRELKRLTQDLQQARERLVSTREEERRRLRRDLHDGLGPQLSSQTLLLTSAQMLLRRDPDAAEAILKSAVTQAQEAISDIRRLVYALRPPALDDLGLVAAIQEQIMQNRAIGIAFSFEVPEHMPPLPAAVEVACYRIAQEGLTNVVRHAHAHSCTVRLTSGEQLTIEIIDDGQGLPPAYRCGVGLTSMRERAEELGGSWLVEAGAHGGTRVQAQIPYR